MTTVVGLLCVLSGHRRGHWSKLAAILVAYNKKLSYRRVTARCVLSVVILLIATQQCRNYLYDKSWPNWWYEVGGLVGGNVSWTMCTHPWRHRVGSHCLKCHKQTDDVELCIWPVYRRLAVANFSKSTMYKLLTWPWPRPLREHSLIKTKTSHGRPVYKIWSL